MNTLFIFFYNITMKTLYRTLFIIYICTLIDVCLQGFQYQLLISLILLIPLFFLHHDKYRFEYLTYVYLTQVLGTVCHFYDLPYYDKVMHFISGGIFVIIAYVILKRYINHKVLLYVFINCVETAVAFLWEVFEYSGLIFFHYDASRHFTTGVHDTMQDMIFSFLAGLMITYLIDKYPSYIDSLYKLPPDNLDEVSQQSHI